MIPVLGGLLHTASVEESHAQMAKQAAVILHTVAVLLTSAARDKTSGTGNAYKVKLAPQCKQHLLQWQLALQQQHHQV